MSDPPDTYVPVRPRWRRRRWWHRVPWAALVWLGGTAGVTWWWAQQPETGVVEVVLMVATAGLLLGAGLIPREGGRR